MRSVVMVGCAGESKLATHYVRIIDIPEIVAHCTPYSIKVNFNTSIKETTICQPKVRWAESTKNAWIFHMNTIMRAPSTLSAIVEMWLVAWARYIIHPNRASSLAVMSQFRGIGSQPWETKLSANNVSVMDVPSVVANRSPLVIVEDLNSSIMQTASP